MNCIINHYDCKISASLFIDLNLLENSNLVKLYRDIKLENLTEVEKKLSCQMLLGPSAHVKLFE